MSKFGNRYIFPRIIPQGVIIRRGCGGATRQKAQRTELPYEKFLDVLQLIKLTNNALHLQQKTINLRLFVPIYTFCK
jgi:hypothetical protein